MRSMSLRDMQISKSEKNNSCPPLPNPGDAPGELFYLIVTVDNNLELCGIHVIQTTSACQTG